MIKIIVRIFIFFIVTGHCLASNEALDKLTDIYDIYEVRSGESLKVVAKKNIDRVAGNYKSIKDYMVDIKKWNPHVKNWRKIAGKQLYVTYPYSPHTGIEWSPSLRTFAVKPKHSFLKEEYHKSGRFLSDNLHMFSHITASQGTFIEEIGNSKLNFEQNSPFTLGVGFAYVLDSLPGYSTSTSIYYSKLTSAGIKTSGTGASASSQNVDIPPEIGATSYLQKNFKSSFANIYGGIDVESFTTFNLEEFLSGVEPTLEVKDNKILYLTAGFGLRYHILSPINIKISASKGVYASGKLNGSKFLLYFNQKLGKRFWYHFLYKQHALSGGQSKLSVGRLGFGLGMSLF